MNFELWDKLMAIPHEKTFHLGVGPRIALFFKSPFKGLQYFTLRYEVQGYTRNIVRIRGYVDVRKGTIYLVAVTRALW